MENNFLNNWNLWYHHIKDDWTIKGYKNIYTIKNNKDFWDLYNNWDKIGGIVCKQFFLMKNNVKPIWEDENNKNGGCWSFKISENNVIELWEELSVLLVTEELLSNKNNIDNELVGLSICLKKNNFCVVKIWNNNCKNNSIKLLNPKVLEKWGLDLIYIANVPTN